MTERLDTYLDLVGEIIAANSNALSAKRMLRIVHNLRADYPVLSDFNIAEDFCIEYAMEDTDASLDALKAFIYGLYQELASVLEPVTAIKRIMRPTNIFASKNLKKILELGLDRYLPSFASRKEEEFDLKKLEEAEDLAKVSAVFELLFSAYMRDPIQMIMLPTYKRKLSLITKTYPALAGVNIDDDGTVDIDIREGKASSVMLMLSELLDSFVEISSFSLGPTVALERAKRILEPTLTDLKGLAAGMGLMNVILMGSLSDRVSTGVRGLDPLLSGGLPKGANVILQGPSSKEKDIMANAFIRAALESNASVMAVIASDSPGGFRDKLRMEGVDPIPYEKRNRLKIVDWYSHRKERVVNVETEGTVIKASQDLTYLGIAMDMALASLEAPTPKRAVIKILGPALRTYDFETVYEFAQSMRAKLKKSGITAYFVLDRDATDKGVLASFHQVFDGVIDINKDTRGRESVRRVGVVSMRESEYQTGYKDLLITKRGPIVMDRADEEMYIAGLQKLEGMDRSTAQNLVRAGLIDIQSIQRADKSDLMAVQGVDERLLKSLEPVLRPEVRTHAPAGVQRWLSDGEDSYARKNYDEAAAALRKAVEADPKQQGAWLLLGRSLVALGEHKEAVHCYDRVLELEPESREAWLERGKALREAKNLAEAYQSFNRAYKLGPDADMDEGDVASIGVAKIDDALDQFERMLSARRDISDAWYSAGVINGEPRKSVGFIAKALKLDPSFAEAWYEEGRALKAANKTKKARACITKALKLNPNLADDMYEKGREAFSVGDLYDARMYFDRAVELKPEYEGRWYADLEDVLFMEILSEDSSFLEEDNGSKEELTKQVEYLMKEGEFARASQLLDELLVMDETARNWSRKARCLVRLKRFEESLYCNKNVLRLDPTAREIWFRMGIDLLGLKRLSEAVMFFDKELALNPASKQALRAKESCLKMLKKAG